MKTINVVEEDFNRALGLAQSAGMQDVVDALMAALDTKREPNMKNISRADIERATGVSLDDVIAYSFYNFADVPAGVNKQEYNGYKIQKSYRGIDDELQKKAKSAIESELSKYPSYAGTKVLMFMSKNVTLDPDVYHWKGRKKWVDNSQDMPPHNPKGHLIISNIVFLTTDGRVVARRGWFNTGYDLSENPHMIWDYCLYGVPDLFECYTKDILDVLQDAEDSVFKVQEFKTATDDMKSKIQDADKSNVEQFVQKQNQQKR